MHVHVRVRVRVRVWVRVRVCMRCYFATIALVSLTLSRYRSRKKKPLLLPSQIWENGGFEPKT